MKKSPIYPNYDSGDYYGCEFDLQVDFTEFLEEARKHTSEGNFDVAPPYPEEEGKKQLVEVGERKNKKSWKSSLFSWLKPDKKSKPIVEPSNTTPYISKPKRGYVSGPIHGNGGGGAIGRPRRPTSGPIMSLFNPTKKVENEIPYMCLDQLNNPHGFQSYGPVYLVT
ncbi:unnamed protein product [Ilex paraguariensis]|uniref:Uncharacterized protein n=1 Tax=Ilex paraguariensis TaxID=185542 RepID=A0ABC8RMA5_9AQUA